ncbi:MAG: VWA domain-containing protein [Lachnospiraceae bacterium]|nr:VWA domain-containing protein [Lachnospiraceae bacterium]
MAKGINKEDYFNLSKEERAAARRKKREAAKRDVKENELDDFLTENEIPEMEVIKEAEAEEVLPPVKEVVVEEQEEVKDRTFSDGTDTRLPVRKRVRPEADLSLLEQNRRKSKEKKEVYIDIVMDGTYSFTTIFPSVYRVLEQAVHKISKEAREYAGCTVHYGLTVLHEDGEPVKFDEEYFTTDTDTFMEAVQNIEFRGGSPDGVENINGAIKEALRTLANHTEEYASRGLIILTDSKSKAPREKYTNLANAKYNNLRFVIGYFYDIYFSGIFPIVDGNGAPAENNKNDTSYYSIRELLKNSSEKEMQEIVNSILRKVSVWNQA